MNFFEFHLILILFLTNPNLEPFKQESNEILPDKNSYF